MKLWPWALHAYARPGVEAACLDLQDGHGQSIPYLLWAAWSAQQGASLTPDVLKRGAALAVRWEQAAVGPLRQARRGLKPPIDGVHDTVREQLRAEVKALELRAEEALMRALEQLAPESNGSSCDVAQSLAAASAAWGRQAPQSVLSRLASILD